MTRRKRRNFPSTTTENGELEGFSEICNRIYRLEDVDVLFQCLLLDQMDWDCLLYTSDAADE